MPSLKNHRWLPPVLAAPAFALLTATLLPGQATNASQGITGIVVDPSGASVSDATVVATKTETGVETRTSTNNAGYFSFPGLQIGTYKVTVDKQGFKSVVRDGVAVLAGVSPNLTIDLPVGGVQEVVTVSGATPTLDTTSTTTGDTRTTDELSNLPLQSDPSTRDRDPLTYIDTLGGVNSVEINSAGRAAGGSFDIVNGVGDGGGFAQLTGFRIDGIYSTLQQSYSFAGDYSRPAPDLVQEIQLVTNENAEYGWDMGSTFELVTKSGANRFHGTVYEYFRNDALDAANYFASPHVASPEKQNNYGVVFSGPIIKDKHFFIFGWEGYRIRTASAGQILTVPTVAMNRGDFSGLLGSQIGTDALERPVYAGEVYDPATTRPDGKGGFIRDPFSSNGQLNVINPARFSTVSSFFSRNYPQPNLPGNFSNYDTSALPDDAPQKDAFYLKTDSDLGNQRLSLAVEYMPKFDSTGSCPNIFGTAYAGFGAEINTCFSRHAVEDRFRVNYTWTPLPTLLVGVHAAVGYFNDDYGQTGPVTTAGTAAGLPTQYNSVLPVVNISGVQGFGYVTDYVKEIFYAFPLSVDLTWAKQNHQLKFGTQYLNTASQLPLAFNPNGNYTFVSNETDLPDFVGGQSGQTTGNAYASFMLGQVDSGIVESPQNERFVNTVWGFYAQDQWRVTPKLTINYGLRWDLYFPPREEHDRIGDFDPNAVNAGADGHLGALTFWGSGAGRNGLTRSFNDYHWGIQPRLGIAIQMDPKMVARAYYGLTDYPINSINYTGRWTPNYGYGATLSYASTNSGVTPAFNNWDNPTFTLPNLPNLDPTYENGNAVAYFNPKDNKAFAQQSLGFSMERQLFHGIAIRAKYAGKLEHGLPTNDLVDLNQIPLKYLSLGEVLNDDINSAQARAAGIPLPYPGFTGSVAQALRPYPQFQSINNIDALVKNVYWHAGIFEVQKNFGSGTILATYTISKMLSNDPLPPCLASVCAGVPVSTQATALPWHNQLVTTSSPGLGGDRPQILNLSWSYHLPFGRGSRYLNNSNSFINTLAGGWGVSAIQQYMSGTPFTLSTSASSSSASAGSSGAATAGIPTLGGIWPERNLAGGAISGNVGCGNYHPFNTADRYLNPNAFVTPAAFTFGNTLIPSNVRTCGWKNEDLSVQKVFPITEELRAQFGADMFNVFNRHNWYGLQTNVSIPQTYGQYTAASDPRTIQFHLRVEF